MAANKSELELNTAKRALLHFSKNIYSPTISISTRANRFFNSLFSEPDPSEARMLLSDLFVINPQKHIPEHINLVTSIDSLKKMAKTIDLLIEQGRLESSNLETASNIIDETLKGNHLEYRQLGV